MHADINVSYANLDLAIHSEHGDVKEMLTNSDSLYAELSPSQQITLEFTQPRNTRNIRDFVIVTEGHYLTIV